MQDECKVHMDSYMASTGSCFMVTWTIFNHHLVEAGPTQNREIMAQLQMLITIQLYPPHTYWCWPPVSDSYQ
jgi:hypothetical protein